MIDKEVRIQKLTAIETREATDEDRAAGKIGTIVGRAVVYDTTTELWPGFTEEVKPGAFTASLKERDVKATFNHNSDLILGRTPKTLRLADGPKGLDMEIDLPDTQAGRDLLTSVKRGDVDGASFTFSVRKGGQTFISDDENTHRVLTDLDLHELGPVTFPQYTTTTVAARSIEALREEIGQDAAKVAAENAARARDLDLRERGLTARR